MENDIRLDCVEIDHYFGNFYGYGSWDGKFWFIGLEEGTGENKKTIFVNKCKKLSKCYNGSREKLLDIYDFQGKSDFKSYGKTGNYPYYFEECKWFENSSTPFIHNTWKPLIQILLCVKGLSTTPPSDSDILEYQRTCLGRLNADHALIELLPIPLYSSAKSHYNDIFNKCLKLYGSKDVKALETKEKYIQYCLYNKPSRIEFLKNKIKQKGNDGFVVFYEKEMFSEIKSITGVQEDLLWSGISSLTSDQCYCYCTTASHKKIFIVEHPSRNANEDYWSSICGKIANEISS